MEPKPQYVSLDKSLPKALERIQIVYDTASDRLHPDEKGRLLEAITLIRLTMEALESLEQRVDAMLIRSNDIQERLDRLEQLRQ